MKHLERVKKRQSMRKAFTLVELLLVISIIAILAALGLGVMSQAQEDAAAGATRSRIILIQKILEIELEDYEVRRSPVSFAAMNAVATNSTVINAGNGLLNIKQLKRMIMADLIRAEMPDGSWFNSPSTGYPPETERIGEFPTNELVEFLESPYFGLTNARSYFPAAPPSVTKWQSWRNRPGNFFVLDSDPSDGIDEEAADRSELLFAILTDIDIDGTPAIDQLPQSAIADTDADGFQEVVDAWGEPITLQWQQANLQLIDSANFVWDEPGGLTSLSKPDRFEAPTAYTIDTRWSQLGLYSKPVLPTQIIPVLTSARLNEIDGPNRISAEGFPDTIESEPEYLNFPNLLPPFAPL